jgi:hypothetical protein
LADQIPKRGQGVVVVVDGGLGFAIFGFGAVAVEVGFGQEVGAAAGRILSPCYV